MKPTQTQLHLPISEFSANSVEKTARGETNGRAANRLAPCDRAFHDWYRFVLSFPPHLVSSYIEDFGLDERHLVLDPFCGTGTTLVESKLHGIQTIGLEANIFAHFASSVKVDWDIDPDLLKKGACNIDGLVKSLKRQFSVIPAKAGIQSFRIVINSLDSSFHRSDDFLRVHQYCEFDFKIIEGPGDRRQQPSETPHERSPP